MNSNRKLAPQLILLTINPASDRARPVSLLASLHHELSKEQQTYIRDLGGRIRTKAGTIITLQLPLAALGALTDLEVVRYVELSESLHDERDHDRVSE